MLVHCMHIRTNTGGQQRHRVTCHCTQPFLTTQFICPSHCHLTARHQCLYYPPSQVIAPPTSPSFLQLICPFLPPLPITQLLPPVLLPLTHHHSARPMSPSAPHPPLSPSHQPLPLLTCHLAPPTSSFLSSPVTQPLPPSPCWPLGCLALVHPCSASWW